MSLFEHFITEGNATADELAKDAAMMDGGVTAQIGAQIGTSTVQQDREEVYAALQYATSFHCLVEEWKDCAGLRPKPTEKVWFLSTKNR